MNGKVIVDCCEAALSALTVHTEEIAELDQNIGDGDHIYNMLRGLEALRALRAQLETTEFADGLRLAANKVLATVGGSSGPLLASMLLGMSKAACGDHTPAQLARMYEAGIESLRQRSKTGKGSKTMMDVLIPVGERFTDLVGHNSSTDEILSELPREAERGMLATRDMLATRGRAAFLGERSRGHIDPGARSSQLIIEAICAHLARAGNKLETSYEEVH